MSSRTDRYETWFFFASAVESILALTGLLLIPSEDGLSFARLSMLGFLCLCALVFIYFGIRIRKRGGFLTGAGQRIGLISGSLLALISGASLFLLRYWDPARLLPIFIRLSPVLWFLLLLGIQSAMVVFIAKNGFYPETITDRRDIFCSAGWIFLVFLLIYLFVSVTGIGVTPDSGYWGEPGVAILGWHAALAVLVGFGVLLAGLRMRGSGDSSTFELILPVIIYISACTLWLSVPLVVLQNSFYSPIGPPAEIPFPYSDAGFYDYLSQSLLIGTDYLGGIPPRPLYVAFLGVLHFFLGQNYPLIITVQTLVLAFFPVAVFFLGKKIHSAAAGVIAAAFAILRELVGLWISSNTRVANSKVLTTDFPTALAIAVLCLVIIWWLGRMDLKSTLVAGGAFGLTLLFRTQSIFALPVILLLAWLVMDKYSKGWIRSTFVFGVALASALAPWLIHNFQVAGKIAMDDPRQVAILFSQYSFTGNLDLSQYDPKQDSVAGRLIQFTLENPAYVSKFIASHFLNTEIGGLLALPLIKPFEGLFEPVNLYWIGWDGTLEWYNSLLLILYLAILAVGIAAAWIRWRWIGLVPLAFNLGYALANGISRFSAWRYNLPVDWIIYFYVAVGMAEIIGRVSRAYGSRYEIVRENPPSSSFELVGLRWQYIVLLMLFSFIGMFPWLVKGISDPRYTSSNGQLIERLATRKYPREELEAFLSQPESVVMEGLLLYPRMYRKDLGIASTNPWPAYAPRDFARMGFLLLKDQVVNAIFITREPLDFPHAADTILVGCRVEDYVETRLIVFYNHEFLSDAEFDPCE